MRKKLIIEVDLTNVSREAQNLLNEFFSNYLETNHWLWTKEVKFIKEA